VGRPATPYSVWSRSLEPLEPDRCKSDPCAPCAYAHLKARGLATRRASATPSLSPQPEPASGGRVGYPSNLGAEEFDRDELLPRDAAMLQALMAVDVSRSMSAFLER
jgi:hypothetical protein